MTVLARRTAVLVFLAFAFAYFFSALLRAITWRHSRAKAPPERWFTRLTDPPSRGPVRPEVRALPPEILRP